MLGGVDFSSSGRAVVHGTIKAGSDCCTVHLSVCIFGMKACQCGFCDCIRMNE